MGVKKALMLQIWRIQQSQALISIFFWSLTLAGVFYFDYVHVNFVKLGIVTGEQIALGTFYLFLAFLGTFALIGFAYDRGLRLWKEQTIVAYERNPYTTDRLMPKEIVLWRLQIETLRAVARDNPEAAKRVRLMEAWIEGQLSADPSLRKAVEDLEARYRKG